MQLSVLALLLVGLAEASVRHKRITCGRKAEPNEVPWQVLVGFRDGRLDAGYTYELCGGTLYNNNTVITAWHCMGLLGEDSITFWIQTGSLSRTDADATWIEVDRVVLHPNGSLGPNIFPVDGKEFRSMVNDIALLRLKSDVDMTPASKPIPLLAEAAPINSFMHCIVSGWGVEHESFESFSMGNEGNYFNATGMKNGDPPDLLRMTYVYPEFNTTSCQSMYRSAYPTLNTTVSNKVELCAGFMGCGDSCNGDSGGPLACLRKGSEHYELAGVVSWGGLCGNSAAPGVYASIPHFKPWIEECTAALDRGIETDNCKHSG